MADEKFISKYTSTEIEAILDKVKLDMQTIQYTQQEIQTLLSKIDNMTQPTKTSDLNNDSGFIINTVSNLVNYYTKTQTYSKQEVDTLIASVTSGGFERVNELPTENISMSKIYLVPSTTTKTKNIYDEYINLDGTSKGWEMIGDTKINLSNYVTIDALNTALANYVTSEALNTLLNAKQSKNLSSPLTINGSQVTTVEGAIIALNSAINGEPTPTPTPTEEPTQEPTQEPTPTEEPTQEPTPTEEPTIEPPTEEPTQEEPTPTEEPTEEEPTPTEEPTTEPEPPTEEPQPPENTEE